MTIFNLFKIRVSPFPYQYRVCPSQYETGDPYGHCHYSGEISLWKLIIPLISDFLHRNSGELCTTQKFPCMSAKYYLRHSDCYQWLVMSHLAFFASCQLQETRRSGEMQRMSESMCSGLSCLEHAENTDTVQRLIECSHISVSTARSLSVVLSELEDCCSTVSQSEGLSAAS